MARRGRRKKPFRLKIKKETLYTIASVLLMATGGLIILSFSRQGKLLIFLYQISTHLFDWGIIFLPFLFLTAGLMLTKLRWEICRPHIFVGSLFLFISLISLTQAGLVGEQIWESIAVLITGLGAALVFLGFGFIGFVILFETSFEDVFLFLAGQVGRVKRGLASLTALVKGRKIPSQVRVVKREERPSKEEKKKPEEKKEEERPVPGAQEEIWQPPSLDLLADQIGTEADRGDVQGNVAVIEKTLDSFGIQARVAEVNHGPSVTQYALQISPGTKLSRITTLSDDLALALAAPTGRIRIEAPIPGRSLIGIEVPNRSLEIVTLKKMFTSKEMKKTKHQLSLALGLDVSGQPVVDNLARMPHVLIAGATGSGKTCCLNSIIATFLFRASPAQVKFILIDPKRVELSQYNGIPHLLTPVITQPEKVISALKWAIAEMEKRYQRFSEAGVRHIDDYNELSGFQALPYIIIIIDELADIIFFSPAEVEDAITKIAQMARATGIHLVIATQRPSVDVLTGLIKANIPCRIAFNVTSAVDSRVIIDMAGAEKLLGGGDMLYIPPDQAKPTRIQGTYVTDPEIKKIIAFIKESGLSPQYKAAVVSKYQPQMVGEVAEGEEVDELFEEALRVICRYDRASASLLQRRLSIGYARAARILDQLQAAGVVKPPEGNKPREVLIKNAEEFLARRKVSK